MNVLNYREATEEEARRHNEEIAAHPERFLTFTRESQTEEIPPGFPSEDKEK